MKDEQGFRHVSCNASFSYRHRGQKRKAEDMKHIGDSISDRKIRVNPEILGSRHALTVTSIFSTSYVDNQDEMA